MRMTCRFILPMLVTLIPMTVLAQSRPPNQVHDTVIHKSHPLLRHSTDPALAVPLRKQPRENKAAAKERAKAEAKINEADAQARRERIRHRHLCTTKDRVDLKHGKQIAASHARACVGR